jgi:MFS family permease
VYFGAIGLGFMFVEIAMMQQLSIFMGHPVYSLVVVLGGLILSAGIGSLASDRWPVSSGWQGRMPALAAAGLVLLYSTLVIPASHTFAAAWLWQRVLISVALVAPCGFLLGFCFPIGMRWMTALSQERNLAWMWAVNGAAGTLGSFAAILVSMETSIQTCVYAGAVCYLLASAALPAQARRTSEVPDAVPA